MSHQRDIATAIIASLERVFPWYRAKETGSPVFRIDLADTTPIGEHGPREAIPVNAAGDLNLIITVDDIPYLIRIESVSSNYRQPGGEPMTVRCPSCLQVGIGVMAEVMVALSVGADGEILWEPPQRATEYSWDGNSTAACPNCEWVGDYQEAYVFNQRHDR
jgi:hypothetical protein